MVEKSSSEAINEELIRNALGKAYKRYSRYEIEGSWRTHHALFNRIKLIKGDKKYKRFVVKQFVPPEQSSDPIYTLLHAPEMLYQREKTNLRMVRSIVKRIKEVDKSKLVPLVCGFSDEYRLLVTEDLGHYNKKKQLISTQNPEEREKLFIDGIKMVGRFVGRCNHYKSDFDEALPYRSDAARYKKYSLMLHRENLLKLYFETHKSCRDELKSYDTDRVREFLKSKKGIDLDARLSEIEIHREKLGEGDKLQHNDCNGLNIVGGKFVDLEDFGYSSSSNDISSYCIIVGLGNNAFIRSDNFTHYRHLYLAYESAYEDSSSQLVAKVKDLKNGDLAQFVREEVFKSESNKYADWTFSFFANAIDRNIQLAATYDRYTEEQRESSLAGNGEPDVILGKTAAYVRELFNAVAGISSKISQCTNSEGVKDFFCSYGELLENIGIYKELTREDLLGEPLNAIKAGGTIADKAIEGWAFPPPQPAPAEKA